MASSTSEADSDNDSPWPAAVRRQAMRDRAAGTFKTLPPARYPVILTPNGPISSAEKLQELAELDSLPETIDTTQVRVDGTVVKKVKICHVSVKERDKMEEKGDVSSGIEDTVLVIFNGEERFAMVVNSLNEGSQAGGSGQ